MLPSGLQRTSRCKFSSAGLRVNTKHLPFIIPDNQRANGRRAPTFGPEPRARPKQLAAQYSKTRLGHFSGSFSSRGMQKAVVATALAVAEPESSSHQLRDRRVSLAPWTDILANPIGSYCLLDVNLVG
jgi:hypothetical protein